MLFTSVNLFCTKVISLFQKYDILKLFNQRKKYFYKLLSEILMITGIF